MNKGRPGLSECAGAKGTDLAWTGTASLDRHFLPLAALAATAALLWSRPSLEDEVSRAKKVVTAQIFGVL